jgi:hypothetical protein
MRVFVGATSSFQGGTLFPEVPYGVESPKTFISKSEELIMAIEIFK